MRKRSSVTILYLETNYLVGIATGRDPGFDPLPPAGMADFRMVIPSVCFFEALAWWEGETVRRTQLGRTFSEQAAQLQRDVVSAQAHSLRVTLEEARVKNRNLLQSIESRLFAAVDEVSKSAEFIALDAEILARSRQTPLIGEIRDNLILHCILAHAKGAGGGPKVFLSGNTKEFGGEDVRRALREAGVTSYFTNSGDVLGWLGARPPV